MQSKSPATTVRIAIISGDNSSNELIETYLNPSPSQYPQFQKLTPQSRQIIIDKQNIKIYPYSIKAEDHSKNFIDLEKVLPNIFVVSCK